MSIFGDQWRVMFRRLGIVGPIPTTSILTNSTGVEIGTALSPVFTADRSAEQMLEESLLVQKQIRTALLLLLNKVDPTESYDLAELSRGDS